MTQNLGHVERTLPLPQMPCMPNCPVASGGDLAPPQLLYADVISILFAPRPSRAGLTLKLSVDCCALFRYIVLHQSEITTFLIHSASVPTSTQLALTPFVPHTHISGDMRTLGTNLVKVPSSGHGVVEVWTILSEPDIVIGVSLGALPLKQKFVQFVPTSARAVLTRSK